MEQDSVFDFELNEAEGWWSVTVYYSRSEEVIFPATYEGKPVKTIGDNFFLYKRVKRIIIQEGFTSIGKRAFYDCTGLTNITLPESLASIGTEAFSGCTGLTTIALPENLASIWDTAFIGCTGLTTIKLPESLVSIGKAVFVDCTGLTTIKLPESLASIGKCAFFGCEGLTAIKLPESLASIGEGAFDGCTGLTGITVDESNPVFCSLSGVVFDKAMTTLLQFPAGKKREYSVPEGIIKINSGAFHYCGLTGISFPQSLLYIESFAFNNEQLIDIAVSELNPEYCSIDGVLFDKEKRELIAYPKNKDKTDYAVPDGVILINFEAFSGCKRLVSITLPESLEFICDSAFEQCEGLKAIALPKNLLYIGTRAFGFRPNFKTITLSRKTILGKEGIYTGEVCIFYEGEEILKD